MMSIKLFLLLLLILPFPVAAQSVETKEKITRIDGIDTRGYEVIIAAPEDEVKNSLSRFLKAVGKPKGSGDYIVVTEPVMNGRKYTSALYAATGRTGNSSLAWIGFSPAGNEDEKLAAALRQLTHDFGVSFHREKIQSQIDESLRAFQAVEKQKLRLLNQNRDLKNRVENNKIEKIQLEKSLVQNQIDLEDLTKRLRANERAQDSIAIATEQIRKVVEMHKERQKKVH